MPPDSDHTRPPAPQGPPGVPPAPQGPADPPGNVSAPGGSKDRNRAARKATGGGRTWFGTTPARLWLLSVVSVIAVAGLFASAAVTLNQARGDLDVLGRDAGPRAMATTELYLALADMDARVADVLLMGTDHELGSGREDSLERYDSSRAQASEALLQAASLTEGDTVEEVNVQQVLDGLGEYEQLATEARLLNDEALAPPGEVDGDALAAYQEATQLMHNELLPKAFNLGLDSSAIVRASHEEGQSSVSTGLLLVAASGGLTVVALIGLQFYLRARFRRQVNVPLIGATAGVLALTIGVILALNSSGTHQRDAKEEGLDTAMALARAEAIATDMQADQSRYLLDPDQADNYQQVYLERAQQVLFRPAGNLEEYYEAVAEVPEHYPRLPGSGSEDDPGTLGYLGLLAQDAPPANEETTMADVLDSYNTLQIDDQVMRSFVAEDDTDAAVSARMEIAHSENGSFVRYTDSLGELTELHQSAFYEGIERGDAALSTWVWLLPAGTVLVLALVVLGVRPRLSEYR